MLLAWNTHRGPDSTRRLEIAAGKAPETGSSGAQGFALARAQPYSLGSVRTSFKCARPSACAPASMLSW